MGLGNIRYASMKATQVGLKREEWALGSESDTFTGECPRVRPFDHCPPLLLDLNVPTQSLSCQSVLGAVVMGLEEAVWVFYQ